MDTISEDRLALVCPILAFKVQMLAELLPSDIFRVVQGLRSWSDQEKLYAQGRTAPGKVVTNAQPGYSWHEFGLAVDIVPMNPLPDWNISHPVWQRLIQTGESLGLYSGSEFSCKDNPHFQLTGKFPVTPNNMARQVFLNAGCRAVWVEAGFVIGEK